jgi:hypothetical protein
MEGESKFELLWLGCTLGHRVSRPVLQAWPQDRDQGQQFPCMRLVDTRLEGRYRTRAFERDNANIGGGNINALHIAPFLCAVRCDSRRLPLASTTTYDHRMGKAPSARG